MSSENEIKWLIEPDDVEWEMDWTSSKKNGRAADKPDKEMIFEAEKALAHMLLNEVVFINSHWWKKDWPEEAQKETSINVNCNDVFAWGCADAETMLHDDIEGLYRMWRRDPSWGSAVWCMIRRNQMPQRPVEKRIREAGIWDLDLLKGEHGLSANHYDGISGVMTKQKYEAYCAWERSQGFDPMPFDAKWWEGWKRFTAANPGWCDAEWKKEQDRRCDEWRGANSYSPSPISQVRGADQ